MTGTRVTVDLAQLAKSFDGPLRDSIRELQSGYQTISECLEQTTAQCELRTAELTECRRELEEVRHALNERESKERCESQRLSTLEQQLADRLRDVESLADRADLAEREAVHVQQLLKAEQAHNAQLQVQMERVQSGDRLARTELAKLQEQLARLADTAVDTSRLQDQLAAAKSELAELRSAATDTRDDDTLREQLQAALTQCERREAELAELRKERSTLAESAMAAAELRGALAAAERELTGFRAKAAAPSPEAELREQLAATAAERKQLESQLAELRDQLRSLGDAAQEAARSRGELAAAQSELARLREDAAAPSADVEAHRLLAAALSERDQLGEEVCRLHEHLASLTATAVDTAQLRGELTAAQAEVSRLWTEASLPTADGEARHQLAAALAERTRLEAELTRLHDQVTTLTDAAIDAAEIRGELAAAHSELSRLREQAALPTASDGLREQLASALAQRDQLEREVVRLHEQLDVATRSAATPTELTGELSAIKAELLRLHDVAPQTPIPAELISQLGAAVSSGQKLEQGMSRLQDHIAEMAASNAVAAKYEGELTAAKAELTRLRERTSAPSEDIELRERLAAAQAERDRLEAELTTWQKQAATTADAANSAAELRGQLTAAQAELSRLREQVSQPTAEAQLREDLAAAETQRQQLETELDSVRLRAAELNEALDEQRRSITEERQIWSEELRQLRRAVERQSETTTRRTRRASAAAEEPRRAANGVSLAAAERRADPVIDTVREQFEALQKRKTAGARARSQ